jgi:membrane protease YdiL (CAAX protease family)
MNTFKFAPYIALQKCMIEQPIRGAIIMGVVFGVANLALCCFALAGIALFVPRPEWGTSAASTLGGMSPIKMFFTAVIFVPLFETLLAQVIPIEAVRRMGGGRALCVLVSAILFGAGHYLNGGIVHGFMTFVGGIVLGFAYTVARSCGFLAAFVTTTTAHAFLNFMLLFVIARAFPHLM